LPFTIHGGKVADMGIVPQQLIPLFDTPLARFQLLVYPLCLLPVLLLLWSERTHRKQLRTSPRGCKKLGLRGHSNLSDEYSPQYPEATSSPNGQPGPWRIKALFIHPIKSCAPVELDTAELSSTGLTWDRQFCFAEYTIPTTFPPGISGSEKKQPRWTFVSLRKPGYEKLVHVRPEVWAPDPEYVPMNHIGDPSLEGVLVINYPNLVHGPLLKRHLFRLGQLLHFVRRENSFRVPLLPPKPHTYPLERISIWKDIPSALNYSRHIPTGLKRYLCIPEDKPFALFRADPTHSREVYRNAPRKGAGRDEVPYQPITAFADAYPLHLLNLASVRDVAERVRGEIPRLSAMRFRANIIVAGPAPYDEDDWRKVRVHPNPQPQQPNQHQHRPPRHQACSDPTKQKSDSAESEILVDFFAACHTIRCRLPNVDPITAARHPTEPDKTLKSFRRIDRGDDKNAALGLQLVPARSGARAEDDGRKMKLRVGDEIEVLERGELVYVKA
jgi:uncharacterized protein YcbX